MGLNFFLPFEVRRRTMTLPDPSIDPRWWSAIDVHGKFHDEHIAFGISCRYVYAAGKLARLGNEALAEEHRDFSERVSARYRSPEDYLTAQLFIGHISSFELFLQELATVVIRKHPQKAGTIQFKLSEILEVDDTEDLVFKAAEEVIRKLTYKKPGEYLQDFCELLSISPALIEQDWKTFIEAKARRDLGVHAGWICNETYVRKLAEGRINSTFSIGHLVLPTDYSYLRIVSETLYRISSILYRGTQEKLKV